MAPSETSSADELMSAYLDRELDEEESAAFEAQLAASPEAQEELAELQQMLQLVKGLPEVEAPPDFYEKVAKKIRRSKFGPEGTSMSLFSLPFQVLSVIVIMVIAATYLMLELDRERSRIEKDPSAAEAQEQAKRERAGAIENDR